MNADLVTLTETNPLTALRRPEGTWSAREVHASGHVHADWRNWEASIKRGLDLLKSFKLDVSAGQANVVSTTGNSSSRTGPGRRPDGDYALTPLGLFAACQQSQLPELDLWFVFAGLQAAGYGSTPPQPSVVDILREHGAQLDSIGFHDNGTVRYARFQRKMLPAPQLNLRQVLNELVDADVRADAANDRDDRNDYNRAPYRPLLVDKLRKWWTETGR